MTLRVVKTPDGIVFRIIKGAARGLHAKLDLLLKDH